MSAYTRLASGVLFPLHERLKGHSTVAVRRDMERSQWNSAAELAEFQLKRLRAFLSDIGQHVPYYRQLFVEQVFNPAHISSVNDLQRLPLLDKPTIRRHSDALRADDAQHLARFNTGGSSGEPLVFYIGKRRVSHDVAAKWRATRWWGVDIGDPEIVVWGSPIELGAQDRVRMLRDRLLRTQLLSAFEMSDARLAEFVATIQKVHPRMLFGYPSSLAHIAQWAERQGERLDKLGIRVAFVTSERLYPYQREAIERVFGCPVANGYGGRDAGFIAHQCPHGGMHITAEDIIVETVGPDGLPVPSGAPGEIVVTHLATRDYPFVRYRTGDVGILGTSSCTCGRGLPLLEDIQGRTTDFVIAADGTVLHGLALIYVLRDLPGIGLFRIEQHSVEHTEVSIVQEAGWLPDNEAKIREVFAKRLGDGVRVDLHFVDDIPRERSGKFRYVVSRIAAAFTRAGEAG